MELRRLSSCGSTQDEAFAAAASGAPTGTAIVAEVQTGGRGSRGQRWASAEGGFWLSVLLRPSALAAPELASIRTGLAIAGALADFDALPPVRLKWPNDLLVDGRKVGGVLVEAHWSGAQLEAIVVGVGLNVRNVPPADSRWPAARLADWLPAVQVDAVLHRVLPAVRQIDLRTPMLSAVECAAFDAQNALRGISIAEPVRGTAEGIASDGQLRVRLADGQIHVVRSGPIVPLAFPASA